ncbi:MAG: UDP-N-acetylmuramoyl-L-alanine--D-glutamate ligase [Verrucomicrobiota bacterium]|jgi:UDP-N-acetylmuramoylalanine--D-glutamate ligase
MFDLTHKCVLVVGLGSSGQAACELLRKREVRVHAVDLAQTAALQKQTAHLTDLGVTVELGAVHVPPGPFDLAVVSPGVPLDSPFMMEIKRRGIPVIGELELGYENSFCLNIAITGTNGKTTTTELVERMLNHCHRKTIAAGNIGLPVCAVADKTRELDFLTLEVSSFQLETIKFFRPAVAVLLNITPDHLDRYPRMADYVRAKARLFMNQQPFDWAIVQSEALAQIRSLGLPVPAKVITFSANNRRADIFLDRGLLIGRLPDWEGPLLDMDQCRLRGPHNAENLMAALAVGRVLRIPLEQMTDPLKTYAPAAHRCELVAEINGVKFVNDSKATNLDAVEKALLSMPTGKGGEPNVLLIAGGRDKGLEYHDIGPLLARRVKQAFLMGETREKIRAAWSLFTPCTVTDSLLEAVTRAAENAASGDVVLLSPACSSFDMFQNYQQRGEVFRQAVEHWRRSIPSGSAPADTSE